MARATFGEKIARVLRFLLALRNPHIRAALAAYGLDAAATAAGWALLYEACGAQVDRLGPASPSAELVAALDAWENRYFAIASAVLEHHAPEVHAQVFRNLHQTTGPEVVLTVSTLVGRIEALREASPGTPERAAAEVLETHGVHAEALGSAKSLLSTTATEDDFPAAPAPSVAEVAAAVDRAWKWYLLWSRIARATIQDVRLLRVLGFKKGRGRAKGLSEDFFSGAAEPDAEEEEEAPEAEEDGDAAPEVEDDDGTFDAEEDDVETLDAEEEDEGAEPLGAVSTES